MYIHMYNISLYTYMYIYIERERKGEMELDRERERERSLCDLISLERGFLLMYRAWYNTCGRPPKVGRGISFVGGPPHAMDVSY